LSLWDRIYNERMIWNLRQGGEVDDLAVR
jgi:hypothetical protein